jgi:Tat protein translocase TatB subunit
VNHDDRQCNRIARRENSRNSPHGASSLGIFEIIIVLAVALVVIGPERMPEVLRAAGKVLRELRSASNSMMRELEDALQEEPERARRPDAASEPGAAAEPPKPT